MVIEQAVTRALAALSEVAKCHRLVGLAVTALSVEDRDGGHRWELLHGQADAALDQPLDRTTLFESGSATKIFVASTLLELLAEVGRDPAEPVTAFLPGFRLTTAGRAEETSLLDLLAHASGLDDPVGGEVLSLPPAAAVAAADGFWRVAPPGTRFSYSNSGYAVLAAVVERLAGLPWQEAVRKLLLGPADLQRTVVLQPGHAVATATGYLPGPGGPRPVPDATEFWGAADSVLTTSGDLARLGQHIITRPWAHRLTTAHVPTPWASFAVGWGAGAAIYDHQAKLIGHAGRGNGHRAQLFVLPEAGLAVGVTSNDPRSEALVNATLRPALAELAGTSLPAGPALEPSPAPFPATRRGRYRRQNWVVDVDVDSDGGPGYLTIAYAGPSASTAPAVDRAMMTPLQDGGYLVHSPVLDLPVYFSDPDGGPTVLQFDLIAAARVGSPARLGQRPASGVRGRV